MVFRFTPTQDCGMMRELIRLKPFAAERGTALDVWDKVAKSLSAALKVPLKGKQIRDRLNLLKTRFKASKQKYRGASGVEELLHAVNVQSHYSDVDGLVRDYIKLERLHQDDKAEKKLSKQRKEADLAQGAIDIVSESNRCRAHRQNDESGSDDSHVNDEESCVSTTESVASTSTLRSPTSAHRPPKSSNAFLAEVKRQEKRYKEQMEMKVREL
ncbi:hypothetical protein PC129_g3758 [Phytophthora cactorum]|uniref:Uncharacterized protein n=1 Tax=Phytophthora cactorum TaxID=29920 RepID=A0A329SRZ8_9STRA|nr:hypothetical protein Pcac1_g19883 [Phytophthora cactorum]KAG2830824.1 hypothetical protein PC112_g7549 [Phytophthora cactorum]KAG2833435.1 hypothetical protein PC111_g6231 [Phytophthora cactorum]KAG2861018.1 hypothetical protein PC113_g7541 [Phytophthora cactorum]KAG2916381.1 hypothetical protein PC114_g7544 [Phytophthora cactorum]